MALVQGTDNPETLDGTANDDTIIGKKGNDTLNGLGANDLFAWSRGDGADVVNGGAGDDTFEASIPYYESIFQIMGDTNIRNTERARIEIDSVSGHVVFNSYNLNEFKFRTNPVVFTENDFKRTDLQSVEHLRILGGTADPPASFQTGAPPLYYSYSTDDNFVFPNLAGTGIQDVSFNGGSGNDVLNASSAGVRIIGLGGTGNDELTGGSANDDLYGQEGNDILRSGGGVNTLVGGVGDDTYYTDNRSNTIFELAGEGYDTVYTTANALTLAPNLEKLSFIGTGDFVGIGNDRDNWLQSGNGNDYLVGLDGNDVLLTGGGYGNTLQGGKGNDRYVVETAGDTLVEFANEGHDVIAVLLTSFTLPPNFEDVRYVGAGAFTGTGNELHNLLWGSVGNDHLIGLGGNDTLNDGGDGSNLLEGGMGDDRYIVASSADTIVELAGQGHDTVETSLATYALPDNVEDLTTTSNNKSFAGNELDNVIRLLGGSNGSVDGRGGNDTLIGGAGNDVLSGGYGNDALIGGFGVDELAGGGGADRFVFTATTGPGDVIHDFNRAEGDKIDVSQILNSLGPIGDDPFGNGVLTIQPFGGSNGTHVRLDLDGSAGPGTATTLFLAYGSPAAVNQSDFIIT